MSRIHLQDVLEVALLVLGIWFCMRGEFAQKIKLEEEYINGSKTDICTWGTSTDD